MNAYYNENDAYAAQWLRNLIAAGLIAPGVVDERDVRDVRPDDLSGYVQCHFFAGIGVWSHALREAGWPDDRPVWTGSCPCQPFSAAGRGKGTADERHLWPHWFHLIGECRPDTVFGEQVASKDGLAWLDLIQADMEAVDYALGAVPFPAAGVGSPQMRQRTYFVARALRYRDEPNPGNGDQKESAAIEINGGSSRTGTATRVSGASGELGCPCGPGLERHAGYENNAAGRSLQSGPASEADPTGKLGDTESIIGQGRESGPGGERAVTAGRRHISGIPQLPGPVNGFWEDADWLFCRDGQWRPVEAGTFPLADGIAGRVGKLRAYGNALNAEAAKAFIQACGVG